MHQNIYRCLYLWSLFYGKKVENTLVDAPRVINRNCRSKARTAVWRKPGSASLSWCWQTTKEGDLISFSKTSHLKETLWHHWESSFLWMNQQVCLFVCILLMHIESFFISLFTENWPVQNKMILHKLCHEL